MYRFPLLSVVARKVLDIPATSACCEIIFSKEENIVSYVPKFQHITWI
jgi:hypothetical protein